MAIAIDVANLGTADPGGSRSTVAITTGSAVASGGFIVTCIGWFGTTTLSSVAGGGLTWTIDKQGRAADPGFVSIAIASAQAPSGLASGTTITATLAANADVPTMGGTSFTGVATSSPVDGTPLGPTGVATAAWSTGNYSIQAGSVIVGTCWNENTASGNTASAGSTEAWEIAQAGGPYSHVAEYRIEGSAGSYAVAGTWGAAQKNTNIGVAYLAAAGGGGATTRGTPFGHRGTAFNGGRTFHGIINREAAWQALQNLSLLERMRISERELERYFSLRRGLYMPRARGQRIIRPEHCLPAS
jgi:hypothetical protein